jgi:hypothetical protein
VHQRLTTRCSPKKGKVGSTHDYANFKESYVNYLEYLVKTSEEREALAADSGNPHWGMLLDKAYNGPEEDTPGLRRICPQEKSNHTW